MSDVIPQRWNGIIVAVAVMATALLLAPRIASGGPIASPYFVALAPSSVTDVDGTAAEFAGQYSISVRILYDTPIPGFSAVMSWEAANQVRQDERVLSVESMHDSAITGWGDANCDGQTNPLDANDVLQFAAGLSPRDGIGCRPAPGREGMTKTQLTHAIELDGAVVGWLQPEVDAAISALEQQYAFETWFESGHTFVAEITYETANAVAADNRVADISAMDIGPRDYEWGDVNCDQLTNIVDVLDIFRFTGGFPDSHQMGCSGHV